MATRRANIWAVVACVVLSVAAYVLLGLLAHTLVAAPGGTPHAVVHAHAHAQTARVLYVE